MMDLKTKSLNNYETGFSIFEIQRAIILIIAGFVVSTIFSHGCHSTPHEDEELCAPQVVEFVDSGK